MRVCLFEDQDVDNLEPLVLTRPVFDLLCGCTSLADKQRRYFMPTETGALIRPHLTGVCQQERPEIHWNDLPWLRGQCTVLVNGRWLPPDRAAFSANEPCVGLVGDDVAYAVMDRHELSRCSPDTIGDCLESWKSTYPVQQAGGQMIRYLWDLVHVNGDQIKTDAHILFAEQAEGEVPGVAIIGPACDLHIAGTAQIDPMVVVDTSRGPVIIDREAVVAAFSRLEGPCYIGPRAHVLGAKIRSGTTIGPQCRVGGEVEASILQGFSNKYHEGFLGHSYLGEWVNLGAGTQNSDLRNDYGEVDVVVNGAQVETGLKKVGCFIGDHTKTGLGTLLNTGTSAGIFCNLLPAGRLLPKYFPSYCSWWNSTMTPNANLPGLMQTAAAVMQRRGSLLTDMHAALFAHVFDHTAGERQRVMIETDRRRLRRSA